MDVVVRSLVRRVLMLVSVAMLLFPFHLVPQTAPRQAACYVLA